MRKLALALVSMAAVACGGIGSKEDAAKALGTAAQAGTAAQGSAAALTGAPVNLEFTINKKGIAGKSGTVDIEMSLNGSDTGLTMTMKLTFHEFSGDGVATLDGAMDYNVTMTTATSGATTTADVDVYMKGSITISGTDNDGELTMDIHMVSSASVTGGISGAPTSVAAKQKLKGTVTADGTTYTYNDEEFEVLVVGG